MGNWGTSMGRFVVTFRGVAVVEAVVAVVEGGDPYVSASDARKQVASSSDRNKMRTYIIGRAARS
jgi:hypothetical protein